MLQTKLNHEKKDCQVLIGKIAAKLLSNILIGKGIIRVGEGECIIRAGGYFNVSSSFKKC